MDPREIIKKYGITLADNTHIAVTRSRIKSEQDKQLIIANKPAILEILLAEKRETERKARERQDKIDAIEGLAELRSAIHELEDYYDRYNEAVEEGYGILPVRPSIDLNALRAAYPRAAAYLRAESCSLAENYEKARAGTKAMERILDGEPYETVIAEMEQEWKNIAMSHIWD